MKRILGLLMLLFSLQAFAGAANVIEEDDIDVTLEEGDADNTDKHPRTLIPVTCVYTDGKVQLTLMEGVHVIYWIKKLLAIPPIAFSTIMIQR